MNLMQPRADQTAFEWIRSGRDELLASDNPSWKGNFVSHLLPKSFEAYAKLLHSIDANYQNIDNPLSEREVSILKIPPCKKLRSFVESLREERRGSRIRWETLAHLFGMPFKSEICHEWFQVSMEEQGCWSRFLFGPDDGNLNSNELSELLSVLRVFTGSQECFFRFAEIPFITTEKPILFRGVLDELPTFLAEGEYQFTPEYLWPADQSWCVCSDYDLTFTIVAGSKELVSCVLNDATLEALEVTPQTRIDSYAPMPRYTQIG
jgi:hypothetical protein